MKREKRNLNGESEKDSSEGEPFLTARQHIPASPNLGQGSEIECPPKEIDSEKREQHGHAAEKRIKKKFGGGSIAIFASPDFYQEKRRDQAHFIKEKPEHEILRGECPVKRGLRD